MRNAIFLILPLLVCIFPISLNAQTDKVFAFFPCDESTPVNHVQTVTGSLASTDCFDL